MIPTLNREESSEKLAKEPWRREKLKNYITNLFKKPIDEMKYDTHLQ